MFLYSILLNYFTKKDMKNPESSCILFLGGLYSQRISNTYKHYSNEFVTQYLQKFCLLQLKSRYPSIKASKYFRFSLRYLKWEM